MDRDPTRGVFCDVFDTSDYLEIERVDCPDTDSAPRFADDDEAVAFVMHRAVRDACPEARAAIREIVQAWDDEVELVAR